MTYPVGGGRRTDPFTRIPPELGVRLRSMAPSVVRETLEGIRHRVERRSPVLAPGEVEELRQVIDAGVHAFLDRVGGGRSAEQKDALNARFWTFGAGEAGYGRTLECLHTGMRTAAAVAWRRLSEADGLTRDHMAALGEAMFAFQEEVSAAAVEGHAHARGAGGDALRRRRTRLLEVLLAESGTAQQARAVPALARAARWRMPERVAVALLYREPVDEEHTEAAGTAPVLPTDVLVGWDRTEPCALVPDPEGPGRLRSLERALRGAHAVLGPSVTLDRARVSLERARDLAELVRTGVVPGEGVVRWADHLPALVLSRDTGLVAEMARIRLAPLAHLRPPQRERMADTLLTWLESGSNANEAAGRLGVHPQTVRYRMRRLEELFGTRLRDPDARFELELVLRARRLLGPLEESETD